jgi:hypothetical protein
MVKVKLSLSIDDEIVLETKKVCIDERVSISSVVEDFLKTYVTTTKQGAKKGKL